MVATTYMERFQIAVKKAIERTRPSTPEAAKAARSELLHKIAGELEITYTAVAAYMKPRGARRMNSENNAKAAKVLRVRPEWLAIGDGEMELREAPPDALLNTIARLSGPDREIVHKLAMGLLALSQVSNESDNPYKQNGRLGANPPAQGELERPDLDSGKRSQADAESAAKSRRGGRSTGTT